MPNETPETQTPTTQAPTGQPTGQTPPAPEATPAAPVIEPPADGGDLTPSWLTESLDFNDLESESPAEPTPGGPDPTPKAEAKPETAPIKPAAEVPPAGTKEAAKPPESKPAEAAPTVAPKAEAPPAEPQKAQSEDERRQAHIKWRNDSEERLKGLYSLSPEEADKMASKPEEVLPVLAARLHMDVYESIISELYANLPKVMVGLMHQQRTMQAAEDEFFGQFPKLRPHTAEVEGFMRAYRSTNPQMKKADFIANVGKAMMVLKGLQGDEPPKPAGAPEVIAREVVTQGNGSFTPAPPAGYSPPPRASGQDENLYSKFAKDLLDDQG